MNAMERLLTRQAAPKTAFKNDAWPALPLMAYDESFAVDGKLILPLENRRGWASCIVPSIAHPSTFIVGLHETLEVTSPPAAYLARLVRVKRNGEVDTDFADGQGFMKANFASEGISVIKGTHETGDGFFVWGNTVSVSGGTLVTQHYLSKLTANGRPDPHFGDQGVLNINTLALEYPVRLMPEQACIFLPDGGILIGLTGTEASAALIVKLDGAGRLDTQFQRGGTLVIKSAGKRVYPSGLARADSQGLFVFGKILSGTAVAGVVMKYDDAGNPSSQFGSGGVSELPIEGYQPTVAGLRVMDDERLVLVGSADTFRNNAVVMESLIAVLDATGSPDPRFNGGEVALNRFDPISDLDRWSSGLPQSLHQEKMLVVGSGGTWGSTGPVIGRFNEDGSADTSFTSGSALATLTDASVSSGGGLTCVQAAPTQVLLAGSVNSRPAILALKV